MIIGAEAIRRRIDSRNGGTTCRSCRYYEEEHLRKDVLFGTIKERCWCLKRDSHIQNTDEGQDCPMFLKTIFNQE